MFPQSDVNRSYADIRQVMEIWAIRILNIPADGLHDLSDPGM